jgi:hypothetical protein
MKKLLIVPVLLSLTACSSIKYTTGLEVAAPSFGTSKSLQNEVGYPSWYTAQNDDKALYAVATEFSRDFQMAVDKSMLSAKRELAAKFSSHIDAMMRDYATELGEDGTVMRELDRTTKLVISRVNLIGVHRENFAVVREDNGFRAFVKVKYSIDESNRLLLNEIKKNRQLNTRLQSSRAFRELEDEVNRIERPTSVPQQNSSSVQLLDVDNEEYRRLRDEALQKPGAVIGHITVR